MERLARTAGLAAVKSVTKTRCEVLVTAEEGTQSGKARKAQEYGKPVFSADDFLAWLAGKGIVDRTMSRGERGRRGSDPGRCRSAYSSRG